MTVFFAENPPNIGSLFFQLMSDVDFLFLFSGESYMHLVSIKSKISYNTVQQLTECVGYRRKIEGYLEHHYCCYRKPLKAIKQLEIGSGYKHSCVIISMIFKKTTVVIETSTMKGSHYLLMGQDEPYSENRSKWDIIDPFSINLKPSINGRGHGFAMRVPFYREYGLALK